MRRWERPRAAEGLRQSRRKDFLFGPLSARRFTRISGSHVRKRGRIVLLHFVGQMPMAGIAWQAINHLAGLQRLGYDVLYVEDHGANPYDPRISSVVNECDYNVAYLREAMEQHGFAGRWAYWDAINDAWHGMSREAVHRLYGEADVLINLCGATRLREEHMRVPARVIIDTDPVYEQIKYAKADAETRLYIDAHTHFFTYGANLGTNLCPVPLCGVPWRTDRPPVDLDLWPFADPSTGKEPRCFTTIASWDNAGKNIEFGGTTYVWSKHVNFVRFMDVPRRRPAACFLAAMRPLEEAVRTEVVGHGWQLTDPDPISADLNTYRAFIAGSRGEFTVAKDIYVQPNSGWFSDRAVCYLASGRPVVTMRTGFTSYCTVGRGLFDYATHG